ncbi:MAG TPA: TIGR01459 family HAD-type hydrolase [Xanthobacteraceae bacterium]|nr:TIGR01459 family HAD-type hydrolase [Xanthobacteraceae bacterium]
MSAPAFIEHVAPLAASYDVILSDVWGVVHNGVAATLPACDALARFRAGGGTVMLITNAPRAAAVVREFIDKLHVPHDAYDGIISSGDVTRDVIVRRRGETVFHIGPKRDVSVFSELGIEAFAPPESADYVVCTGLFDDDREQPENYRPLLTQLLKRGLLMVCANPDLVVERGDRLVYCAGAVADLYASLGGKVLYAGKPHAPIYEMALARAAAVRGQMPALDRVLAIGDSVRTDLTGANSFGIDCLFVTAGIHAEELGGRENPDAALLQKIFAGAKRYPKAVMRRLVW